RVQGENLCAHGCQSGEQASLPASRRAAQHLVAKLARKGLELFADPRAVRLPASRQAIHTRADGGERIEPKLAALATAEAVHQHPGILRMPRDKLIDIARYVLERIGHADRVGAVLVGAVRGADFRVLLVVYDGQADGARQMIFGVLALAASIDD